MQHGKPSLDDQAFEALGAIEGTYALVLRLQNFKTTSRPNRNDKTIRCQVPALQKKKKKKMTWLERWVGVEALHLEAPLGMLHCLFPQLQRPFQAVTA